MHTTSQVTFEKPDLLVHFVFLRSGKDFFRGVCFGVYVGQRLQRLLGIVVLSMRILFLRGLIVVIFIRLFLAVFYFLHFRQSRRLRNVHHDCR